MAFLNWQKKSKTGWTPASYTASAASAILAVDAGDLVGEGFCRVTTLFDGTGTAAKIQVGLTGGDVDLFCLDGDVTEGTAGLYHLQGGTGSNYLARGSYLFTAADTIDVLFTHASNSDGAAGVADFWFYVAKVDPH